jgi:hypothetical protein
MIFEEIHDQGFAYKVTVYGMANTNQNEKRRM